MARKLINGIKKFAKNLLTYARKVWREFCEYRAVKRKKELYSKVLLTKEQKEQIDQYFTEHYGKRLPYHWHRLYQSYTGTFRKDYFPEILFSTRLEPLLNDEAEATFIGNKSMLEVFYGDDPAVHIPQTFGACLHGSCRDADKMLCTKEHLAEKMADIGQCVVKKTAETDSGRDVMLCDFSGGTDTKSGKTVLQILDLFGKDFLVQERIYQSEALSKLNPTSVNTFRVISYLCGDEICVCPIALRMGRNGADKDNIHYGGISIGVRSDGTLRKEAFSEMGECFSVHPDSQVVFEGYAIPGAEKLAETAKRLHNRVLYLGIVSWDMTIDRDGNITIIETNTVGQSAWFPKMVNGEPFFGENTPKMLAMIKKK